MAVADTTHAHAVAAAVLWTGRVRAVGAHVGLVAQAAPVHAAPVATARPGAGGQLARGALPALLAVAAAGVGGEGAVPAAVAARIWEEEEKHGRQCVGVGALLGGRLEKTVASRLWRRMGSPGETGPAFLLGASPWPRELHNRLHPLPFLSEFPGSFRLEGSDYSVPFCERDLQAPLVVGRWPGRWTEIQTEI